MSSIKTAIFTVAILLVALVAYIFVSFDNNYLIECAFDAFAKGEYEQTKQILEKIPLENTQLSLYKGYIERACGDIYTSNSLFANAATSKDPSIRFEALWNQSLNFFLLHDSNSMQGSINVMITIDSTNPWIPLLNSLSIPEKTFSLLEIYTWPTLSSWMKKQVTTTFSPFWESTTLARIAIEKEHFVQARSYLDAAHKNANDSQRDELDLLLATSYIREGEKKPAEIAVAYYKLALPHLSRLPLDHQRFNSARSYFSQLYKEQAVQAVERHDYDSLLFFGYALDRFHEENAYATLIEKIDHHLENLHERDYLTHLEKVLNRIPANTLAPQLNQLLQKIESKRQNDRNDTNDFTLLIQYYFL